MLMNRASAWMVDKPRRDAFVMKTAKTLQAPHGDTDFKFLQADCAFGIIHTILFRSLVRVHAAAARCHCGDRSRFRIDVPRAAVPAMLLNTLSDVGFP